MKNIFLSRICFLYLLYNLKTHKMKKQLIDIKPEFNLAQQIEHYQKTGKCIDREGIDSCSNFFDWFCKDTILEKKAADLMNKVIKFLSVNPQIDPKKHYVFFKNNCPVNAPLYDSFSICQLSGDVQYWVSPKSGHSARAEVYTPDNKFESPIKSAYSFADLIRQYS
jgi:hypothetical protein